MRLPALLASSLSGSLDSRVSAFGQRLVCCTQTVGLATHGSVALSSVDLWLSGRDFLALG